MAYPPLTDEVALRIALAVRVLPGMEVRLMVPILIDALGYPITIPRLQRLRLGRLRQAAKGLFDATSDEQLREVLSLLKGRGIKLAPELTPSVNPYRDGEMPGSIRVACTSDHGEKVGGSFSTCIRFLIYQVAAYEARLIEIRDVPLFAVDDDKNQLRAALIRDCHVLYTLSIGGPAAAKVVRVGVHPIKIEQEKPARELIRQLQTVLQLLPPPWLAKAMGDEPAKRVRFALSSA